MSDDPTRKLPSNHQRLNRRSFIGTAGTLAVGALAGLSGGGAEAVAGTTGTTGDPVIEWGPRVDLTGLRENFAPQDVRDFTVPPGGIDYLGLHSVDMFEIPGQGAFEVPFSGYFRVARAQPSTFEWGKAMIAVNIIDLRLSGLHDQLGEIHVTLNPDILAAGQIFPADMKSSVDPDNQPAKCRIAVGAVFSIPHMGFSLFNKEPILLMNENLTRIPPVDDPNGHALLFKLPLYDVRNPQGPAVAYLTSLNYGADHYLTQDEVRSILQQVS